jgi:hypothetical protein
MAKAAFKTRAKQWSRIWHANIGIAAAITLGAVALSCPFIAHKELRTGFGQALMDIHYGKFLAKEWRWVWIDTQGAALFFLIVSGWLIHFRGNKKAAQRAADDPSAPGSSVTILWESGCPPAEAKARELAQVAEERGLRAFAIDSRRYPASRLPDERWLICVLGGENGTLPLSLNGEKLPRLEFALLGVDSQAVTRCESLGAQLSGRGARSFVPLGRLASAEAGARWKEEIVRHLARFTAASSTAKATPQPATRPATI